MMGEISVTASKCDIQTESGSCSILGDDGSTAARSVTFSQQGHGESPDLPAFPVAIPLFGVLQQADSVRSATVPQHAAVGAKGRELQQHVRPGRMQPQAKITLAMPGNWRTSARQQVNTIEIRGTTKRIETDSGRRDERYVQPVMSLARPSPRCYPDCWGMAGGRASQTSRNPEIPMLADHFWRRLQSATAEEPNSREFDYPRLCDGFV
jgi:hypothetical protein